MQRGNSKQQSGANRHKEDYPFRSLEKRLLMKRTFALLTGGLLFILAGAFLYFSTPTLAQDAEATEPPPLPTPVFLQDTFQEWVNSPHADRDSGSFTHWDEDGEIPTRCAKCHSAPGSLDYLGADGTEFGVVDSAAPLGTVVNCDVCHNDAAATLDEVTFPSGFTVSNDLGDSAICMTCHQGRSSGADVTESLAEAGLTDDLNTVSEDLGFINIHFYAAAASLFGSEVHAGYEFEGEVYQMRYEHVDGYDTCTDCHDSHSLELKIDECQACHEADDIDEVREIRMQGSFADYDGDGDIEEGIGEEISTLQEMLYSGIQTYAADVAGTPIVYSESSYPYFFVDTNGDGVTDDDEANYGNRYTSFTGNLLIAAYNYQVTQKDPGAYVHNSKYHIELLHDTIDMINDEIDEPIDMAGAMRNDPGHFNAVSDSFRHWDEDGEVSGRCTKCHTSEGLPFFFEHGTTISFPPSNSLECATCHEQVGDDWELYVVNEVEMPSGAVVSFGEEDPSNMCLNCHQGRQSTDSVNSVIARADVGPDESSEDIRFQNPHYFAAGATMFGAEARGGYQYDGMEYAGQYEHARRVDTCTGCHTAHSLENRIEQVCVECHEGVETSEDLREIRWTDEDDVELIDYDGDGDATEPIADEITTLYTALFDEIQTYTAETVGTPLVYDAHSYPYWFIDTDGDGETDADEANYGNQYNQWTPTLLRAAYNYQYSSSDSGGYAHNADYILQLLYDSLEDIGGDDAVADFTRPPVDN
jgi:hypothetical protein